MSVLFRYKGVKELYPQIPPTSDSDATCPVNQRASPRSVGQKRKTILRSIVKEDWQFRSELTRPSAEQLLQHLDVERMRAELSLIIKCVFPTRLINGLYCTNFNAINEKL